MFFTYPSPAYGNCFSFNKLSNSDNDPDAGQRVSSLTGPKFGLSFVLNIHPEAYMTNGRTEQVFFNLSPYKVILLNQTEILEFK